jgi:thymidylate synthase
MNELPPGESGGELLLYQTEDLQVKLEVRLQNETVWLTQPLMAELFQTTQQNISQHIRNIFEEGELTQEATHKKFLSVRQEGGRDVRRAYKESIGEAETIKQLEEAVKELKQLEDSRDPSNKGGLE